MKIYDSRKPKLVWLTSGQLENLFCLWLGAFQNVSSCDSFIMFVLHAVLMSISTNAEGAQGTICNTASYWTKHRRANELVKSWQSVT
jgi:hypothetical protein